MDRFSKRRAGRLAILGVLSLLLVTGCALWEKKDAPTPRPGNLLGDATARNEVAGSLTGLPTHNEQVNAQFNNGQPVTGAVGAKGGGVVRSYALQAGPGAPVGAGPGAGLGPDEAAAAGGGTQTGGQPAADTREVILDFNEVSLKELLQVIFEEYLQVPYTILDTFVDKKVNFVYRAQASQQEMLAVLEAFLGFHGVSLVYGNGMYAITTDMKGVKGQPTELGLGWMAGAFQLSYLSAKDFLNVARQFLDQPTYALEISGINSVFLYAPGAQYKAVQMLYERLDVPYFEGKHLIVYAPRFLSVGALKALIDHYHKMLGGSSKQGSKLFEVEGINELNELVIVAADGAARDMIIQFLHSTDRAGGNQWQVFQFVLTNQKAGEVLASVRALMKSLFKDEARAEVVADKSSNSLFVTATPEDYAEIVKLIERLDYRPPAVHIEVVLAEVVLTDSMKYGVEWFLFGDQGDTRTSGQLDLSKALIKGLTLDIVDLGNDKFITMEVLAELTDFNILANPQLVVKNGSTANLLVGQEIAIEKSTLETNTAGSSAKTEFERRDVAITLEVTPTIGADQQIQIIIKLTDERDIGRDINGQPVFAKREIKTDLVAYDGDTLFIGGIIRDRTIRDQEKIPILGDLAYVGNYLFSNHEVVQERTELIMLVTPRLVLDNEGANLLTQAIVSAETTRMDGAEQEQEQGGWGQVWMSPLAEPELMLGEPGSELE